MDTSDETATNLKQGITSDLIRNITPTLVNEEKEIGKEEIKLNLILHNIKNSNDADISKWKEKDSAAALILGEYVNVPVSIDGCFWIDKKRDHSNKQHLFKITVNPLGEKITIHT